MSLEVEGDCRQGVEEDKERRGGTQRHGVLTQTIVAMMMRRRFKCRATRGLLGLGGLLHEVVVGSSI